MSKIQMPMQRLGRTGLQVSRLSFGSWVSFSFQIQSDAAYEIMKKAFESGINLFDNAEAYAKGQSETIMGVCIQRGLSEKVWTRGDLVITTKLFFGTIPGVNNRGLSRKHIVEGTVESLKRLQLEYVDIIYAHRPDPTVPMEEIVRAFNHVIDRGYSFYWGTSEWSAAQIADACGIADRLGLIRPVVEQPEYNIFARTRVESEYEHLYHSTGLGLTTWSPLASGILTGKYSGKVIPDGSRFSIANYQFLVNDKFGANAWQIAAADELVLIAKELNCTSAQLALAWCLKNPRVSSVILGATSTTQLEENLGALTILPRLTPELIERIENIGGGRGKPAFPSSYLQSIKERVLPELTNFPEQVHF